MKTRKPLIITSWKMSMTVDESLAFVGEFQAMASDLLDAADVILCPPFTALWAVSQALRDHRIQLGGQNMAPSADLARTGEISATLLADAGCRWVMLGHWEVRRHLGDDDARVNRKVHLALEAGLVPIPLVGEARDEKAPLVEALGRQVTNVLAGCRGEQVGTMAFVYEPEGAIGVQVPASPEHAAAGCSFIRSWLRDRWGDAIADQVRIIYGGSVAPEYAADLLACADIDGLGATRRGRNPTTFTQIVRLVVGARAQRK